MPKPPAPGTPMESLMLLVWRMKQDARMLEARALIQAITFAGQEEKDQKDLENLNESWREYTDEMFPFQRGRVKRQDQSAIEFLKQEVAKGPLKVTPLQYLGKSKSRIRKSGPEAMSRLKRTYGVK